MVFFNLMQGVEWYSSHKPVKIAADGSGKAQE